MVCSWDKVKSGTSFNPRNLLLIRRSATKDILMCLVYLRELLPANGNMRNQRVHICLRKIWQRNSSHLECWTTQYKKIIKVTLQVFKHHKTPSIYQERCPESTHRQFRTSCKIYSIQKPHLSKTCPKLNLSKVCQNPMKRNSSKLSMKSKNSWEISVNQSSPNSYSWLKAARPVKWKIRSPKSTTIGFLRPKRKCANDSSLKFADSLKRCL